MPLRAALIVVAGLLAYSNSFSGPFLFDDQNSITDNPQIRRLWPLSAPLSPPSDTPVAGRPLVNFSFALNYAFGGLRVEGYHFVNVAIHIGAALFLFGIVRRTLKFPKIPNRLADASADIACAGALIWMLHPLQTEAVNYLSERTESLMGLLYLATLYAAIRALDDRQRRRWQLSAIAACALGMACKESMVTAPAMAILYDRIFAFDSFKLAARQRWPLYAGLAGTWVLLAALMSTVPRTSIGFSTGTTPREYLLNQMSMVAQYLRLTIWPRKLVLDYGLPQALTFADVIGPTLVVIVLILATVVALLYRPRVGFLGAWFFITLAPTSSFVPIATEVGAERRMYLPLAGLVMLAVVGWTWVVGRREALSRPEGLQGRIGARRLNASALAVVCILLAAGTLVRNREYASRLEMARTIVERRPHGRAHFALGSELVTAGRQDEAMAEFRASARDYPGARYALGTELIAEGSLDQGIAELRAFIRALPSHPNVIPAREMIGRALVAQKQFEPAAEQLELLLKVNPSNPNAHLLLGNIRLSQSRFAEAVAHYEQVMNVQPGSAEVLENLGIAQASMGNLDQAAVSFQKAIAANPGDPVAPNLLGRALASRGRFAEAAAQFRRAVELDPAYGEARANLAAAEAATRGN